MDYAVILFIDVFDVVLIRDLPALDNLVLIESVETAVFNTLAVASTLPGAEVFTVGANAVTLLALASLLDARLAIGVAFEIRRLLEAAGFGGGTEAEAINVLSKLLLGWLSLPLAGTARDLFVIGDFTMGALCTAVILGQVEGTCAFPGEVPRAGLDTFGAAAILAVLAVLVALRKTGVIIFAFTEATGSREPRTSLLLIVPCV